MKKNNVTRKLNYEQELIELKKAQQSFNKKIADIIKKRDAKIAAIFKRIEKRHIEKIRSEINKF
jgi:hypothetical protein